jgi:hypothetical protein
VDVSTVEVVGMGARVTCSTSGQRIFPPLLVCRICSASGAASPSAPSTGKFGRRGLHGRRFEIHASTGSSPSTGMYWDSAPHVDVAWRAEAGISTS